MGLTKAQLEALNDSSFPNNNAGYITPAILRDYNDAVIGNTVNQDVYSTDSASFSNRIEAIDDDNVTTSSFNAYTQSTNDFTASISTSVGLLQEFSGSQYKADSSSFDSRINGVVAGQGFVLTSSFNAYTQSNDTKVNNLNTISASYLAFTQSYYSDSSSFSSRIEAIDDDNVTTASFNSYTSSTNSRLNSIESFTASVSTSVGLLQTFSGSQYKTDSASFDSRLDSITFDTASFVTTSSFNSYTSSNDTKVNNLTNATSSYAISSSVKVVTDSLQTQINGLATTSSVNTLSTSVDIRLDALETAGYVTSAITASSLVTASVSQSTITFTKGDGSQFNIVVADVSGAAGNFVTTASFNSYTASQDFKNTTFATTGSNTFTGNQTINADLSVSQSKFINIGDNAYIKTNNIGDGRNILTINSDKGLEITNATTGGFNIQQSGPTKMDIRSLASGIEISGSYLTLQGVDFIPFSSSVDSRLDGLELSGSGFVTTASFNAYTQSTNNQIATIGFAVDDLIAKTGSYATTGSNTFVGNQIVNGAISASGNISASSLYATNATIVNLTTIYETSSVIYSSGSNQLGDELTDVQILSGSVQVVGGLTLNGVSVSTQSVDISSLNAFTASQIVSNSYFATTGSNTFVGNQTINGDLSVSQSKSIRIGDNQSISTIFGNSLVIDSQGGNLIRNSAGGGNITLENSQGIVNISGSGTSIQNVDFIPFSSSLDSRINSITVDTSSLVTTASFNAYTQSTNTFTASISTSVGLLQTFSASSDSRYVQNSQTSSMAVSSSTYAVTASFAVSSSLATNAKDIIVEVKNTTGAQINKGTVVRIIGAVGDNALISTASWEDDNNSANTLGFVVTDIPNDSFGTVMTQGTLLSVNTDPALGYAAGQLVYLSSSGQFTNVIPPAPYHEVRLGQVLRAQQNNGSIYVLIQNGYELSELHDVNIVSASNYDLLAYNSASGQWENKSIGTLGIATTSSVNDLSASIYQTDVTQSINIASNSSSIGLLQTFSGSQYKADSASFDTRINSAVTINTSSFATTGSNTFIGDQSISGSVSIINSANGEIETLKILPYLSSSTFNGNRDTIVTARLATSSDGVTYTPFPTSPTNLIFGRNAFNSTQAALTATSIVSGSNNIIVNERLAATNGAEIEANNSYISVFPSTRTPAYAPVRIQNSTLNGLLTVTNASVGLSSSLAAGSLGFGNGTAASINNSGIFTTATLNPNSSSIFVTTLINAGTLTVNGNKTGPAFTGGAFSLFSLNNIINVGSTTLIDIASGSFSSGNTGWNRNLFGGSVTATNIGSATASANLQSTIAFGSNLIITGSDGTAVGNGGSAFFGRYNLNDGVINSTANVVFAVGAGTGTGTNTRTPLWVGIDQSVNITGSLKVNGSTVITGSNLSIDTDANITASTILLTGTGTTAIQYNQTSTGSVNGVYATSYGKDNLKVYQYQGQPYAFNVNLTANQANAYTGSQFEWALQLNGNNVSLPGGGGTYFAMVSGSTTGSGGGGEDKKGLNYLGTAMIMDMIADTSFRRRVYVDQGMFVSQSAGGTQVAALTVDGTSAANNRAINATGSVSITGSLTVNGAALFAPSYGSFTGSAVSSGVMTTYNQEFASGIEIVSSSFVRVTTTGVYQVTAIANFDAEGSSGNVNISLKKNGTTISATTISQPFSTNSQIGGVSTTALVELNAFEYVEVGIDASDDTFLGGRVSIVKIA